MMVSAGGGRSVSAKVARVVHWSTRLCCLAAVAAQTALLSIEVRWALNQHRPASGLAGQFGLFVATVLLAGAVFRLTVGLRPVDSRRRLARSRSLRLAAIHAHQCGCRSGWDGLPGRCAGQRRPAA
jgi:hypothetical protein